MNFRPFTAYFLDKVSASYDVVVYNSAPADQTKAICDVLDPNKKIFKRILSKEDCLKSKMGFFVKDLRLVSGLDTSRTVLLDSSVQSFAPQIANGIPILPFTIEQADHELVDLLDLLMLLKDEADVTGPLKTYFGLDSLINCSKAQDLLDFCFAPA